MAADCRRNADETPHHGPARLHTAQHEARPEPWIVQHLCVLSTTANHAFLMFPKPGVAGSIPAGGTSSYLHRAIPEGRSAAKLVPDRRRRRQLPTSTRLH